MVETIMSVHTNKVTLFKCYKGYSCMCSLTSYNVDINITTLNVSTNGLTMLLYIIDTTLNVCINVISIILLLFPCTRGKLTMYVQM
jgi:hypothetical protein